MSVRPAESRAQMRSGATVLAEVTPMMTVHVLHAGDGYTYLTRQVASADHKRVRGESLADYY